MAEGVCRLSGKYYPSIDSHHIVPTGYGGANEGVQVLLGPDIHQTMHRCVGNPKLKDQFISGLPPQNQGLATTMIQLIIDAKLKMKDSNGIKNVTLKIPIVQYEKLVVIAQNMGISVNKLLTKYVESL